MYSSIWILEQHEKFPEDIGGIFIGIAWNLHINLGENWHLYNIIL